MSKQKNTTISKLIEAVWTKDDQVRYRQMKKDIKLFNKRHFSTTKNVLYSIFNVFLAVSPILLSLLIYLISIIFIDRLGKQLVTIFDKSDLLSVSIAIVSITLAFYSTVVVSLIIGANKGDDYFCKTESKMFLGVNSITRFDNNIWLINASLMMALAVLSFLMKDYAGLFSAGIFVFLCSSILLFSFLRYKNKSGKEKCLLYLKSLGLMKQKVRGLSIRENRLFRKHLKDKLASDVLLSKIIKLNRRTLGSLVYLMSNAKDKTAKDLNVKEEQNILEDFFMDYALTICSVSQAILFVSLCNSYIDLFASEELPKQNIKDSLLSRKSIIKSIKIAISSFKKSITVFPLKFDDLPELLFFKKDQIETMNNLFVINSYYSFTIFVYKHMFECANKIINGAPKTQQAILRKEIPNSEIKDEIDSFTKKYDCSKQINNYIEEKIKIIETITERIKRFPEQVSKNDI